jgi:CBS domain-containing protein
VDRDGGPVGVVSKTDLVDPAPAAWIKGEAYAADLMNPDVVVIYADDPALAAAQIMAERRLHRLVVMDPDGRVVGIVTAMDVVRAVARGDGFSLYDGGGRDILDAA